MKYFKTLKVYKNSSGSCLVDVENCEAWSYKWWQFVKKENGLVIFNWYGYSNSTRKHQYSAMRILEDNGIKVDLSVHSHKGLQADWKPEVFEACYKSMFLSEYKLTKKGMSQKTKARETSNIENQKEELIKLSALKYRVSKERQKQIRDKVTADYEKTLATNREANRAKREKRKEMLVQVSHELKSLSPLNTYAVYDQLNNLKGL